MGCEECGGDHSQYCSSCRPQVDIDKVREEGLYKILDLHSRALACHCECLGMNAENSWAVCANTTPPYSMQHYQNAMLKWGLTNEKGEPII